MVCADMKKNLFGYLEDKLPADVQCAFEEHLQSCKSCSEIVSECISFEKLISKEKTTVPNTFAGTRILQRLESELESRNYHRRINHLRFLQPALITFSLILALFIGFLIGRENGLNVRPEGVNKVQTENLKSYLFISDFIDEEQTLLSNK